METVFRAACGITAEDDAEMQRFTAVKTGALAFLIVFTVFMLYIGIVLLPMGIIFILTAVLFLICYVIRMTLTVKVNEKLHERQLFYTFSADGWSAVYNGNETKFQYDKIKVYERETLFYIIYAGRTGFILKKDGFSEGTAEEFASFMSAKLGRKFKPCAKG